MQNISTSWPGASFLLFHSQTQLQTHSHTHFYLPLSLTLSPVLILHNLHHLFTARSPENSLGISKASSSLLFEVNFLIFLVGLYTFARDFRYLSFDYDTHVIYKRWK